ncbi:hypothetical protein D9756_008404 [Leucocoprinus leucothites]|uniref:G domain-containing protein n=1 Tax=Leucocoprinus leucothites TaxID=201217 RepID=A0A8H5FVD5_9AGAR|nr:hypothetical protein D9756_008404 [Leucoagaricus leucothites]
MGSSRTEAERGSMESIKMSSERIERREVWTQTTENERGRLKTRVRGSESTRVLDDAQNSTTFPTGAPEDSNSNNTIGNQRDNELTNNPTRWYCYLSPSLRARLHRYAYSSSSENEMDKSLHGQTQSELRSANSSVDTPNVDDENAWDIVPTANEMTHSTESSTEQHDAVNSPSALLSSRSTPQRNPGMKKILPMMRVYEPWDFAKINHVTSVGVEDLNEDDAIIVTNRFGKKHCESISPLFIRTVTGMADNDNNQVGHHLSSATSQVSALRITFTNRHNTNVVLVDTPGLDDQNKSDDFVLTKIAQWLRGMHSERKHDSGTREKSTKPRISGILYLHRITDIRLKGSILKNLVAFQMLCGEDFYDKTIIATTMWPSRGDPNFDPEEEKDCRDRDQILRGEKWKSMIDSGLDVSPFTGNPESAHGIINRVVDAKRKNESSIRRWTVRIQQETTSQEESTPRTQAGKYLRGIIKEKVQRQSGILNQLRTGSPHSMDQSMEIIEELLKQLRSLQQEKEEAARDLQKLERHWIWNSLLDLLKLLVSSLIL